MNQMLSPDRPAFAPRLAQLAAHHPERPAIIFAPQIGTESELSWRTLDETTNQLARCFARRGVSDTSTIVIALWNSPEHIRATIAAWKLGALVLPLRAALPARERDELLALAQPALVVSEWDAHAFPAMRPSEFTRSADESAAPLPLKPHPGKAIGSGGSTGRSKMIVDRTWNPVVERRSAGLLGVQDGQTQLVAAPLYHNSPFLLAYDGLARDHTLVVMERFDAARAVELIERWRVSYAYFPPIIMRRIALLPDIDARDLSSFDAMHSSAAPCPEWLKRRWIELLGAEKVHEVYGSAEGVGATVIRGDEWLAHPGSVGRPIGCELRVLDEQGVELPIGEVGELFMKPDNPDGPTFEYIGGAPLKRTTDGFYSIGDLGRVDADGYLYIADRRVDMIVSGGANVYPAEVEAALSEYPGLTDVAVIGVPDEEWGRRVHAIIQPRDPAAPPSPSDLDTHTRERIAGWKAPKTYEFLVELPRNEAGKIRRSALAAERESGRWEGMLSAKDATAR
jgi:bile acid-coenzyme A ligase